MAGFGFVRDAQNSAKQNRANLKNKINFSKTQSNMFPNKELKFKEATPEELISLRKQFLDKERVLVIKRRLLFVVVFLVVPLIIWMLLS